MKQRVYIIDILKGVAIIMVVIQHVMAFHTYYDTFTENHVWKFITLVNMPLFMILAGFTYGYTYRQKCNSILKEAGQFTLKKGRQLLLPYFTWTIILSLSELLWKGCFNFPGNLIEFMTFKLWFLWALFWIAIFFNICVIATRRGGING